jgi:hypothetical protein
VVKYYKYMTYVMLAISRGRKEKKEGVKGKGESVAVVKYITYIILSINILRILFCR